jgi:uncharacterized protein (TIGR00369 family)
VSVFLSLGVSFQDAVERAGGFKNFFESVRRSGGEIEKEVGAVMAANNPALLGAEFRVTMLGEGQASLTFPMSRQISRFGGVVHGGVVLYCLDSVMGLAVMSENTGINQYTLELKVNFLEPLADGPFTASGKLVRMGRVTAVAQGEVRDVKGKLCAAALGTWYLVRARNGLT